MGSMAQNAKSNWSFKWNYTKAFIENKGQFDGRDKLPDSKILYAVDHSSVQMFFTKKGLTYHLNTRVKNPDRKKGDSSKPKKLIKSDFVYMTWEGANPDVEIIAEGRQSDYHTYSMMSEDRSKCYDIRNIRGYSKLIYKNLYPNIDVEYIFHAETGIEYSLVLRPGADITKVKMKYADGRTLSIDEKGQLKISTMYGDIVEHAPVSFYADNKNNIIESKFSINNNTVQFALNNYDNTKNVVIDPWVQTPALLNSNGVWELDKDAAGNIYIIGGDMPMKLQKYTAAGALVWTYSTPWDTLNNWLGTLATDLSGNSYITSGSTAVIQKVSTAGSMLWNDNGGMNDEYWMIVFNCDQTKLIIGGTRLVPMPIQESHGVIFDVSPVDGSVLNLVEVAATRTYTLLGVPATDINEVRALSSSRDAKYYYLTLDTMGCINQNMNLCSSNGPLFSINSSYNFGYKCEKYRPNNGNAGIRSIRANQNFVYTQNGTTVDKRSLADGSIISSAPITGGLNYTIQFTPYYQAGNSGIAVDSCGSVYVGSGDRVIKFDQDLNVISEEILPFAVSDVIVSPGGNVVVCGTTGTNEDVSRTGYVQSINMSACLPFALVCCNTTICPAGPFCPGDPDFQLVVETPGGTFSGPGVDPTSGVFSPSAAGIGTHSITYTLPCGSSFINVTVNPCAQLSVCVNPFGDLVVSGGTAPYTWDSLVPASTFPITTQAECTTCGYTWNTLMSQCLNGFIPVTTCSMGAYWQNFASGDTINPPVGYPVQAVDANGDFVTVNDFASLAPCAICSTYTVTASAITNATCVGGTNGTFTAEATGGNGPYTYTLLNGSTTVVSYPGITGPQNFSNLPAGTYTLNTYDTDNCPGTTTVVIGEDPFVVSANSNSPICEGAPLNFTATGGSVYSWAGPNGFTSTIQNPAIMNAALTDAGVYTVTISVPPCSDTVSLTVVVNPAPTADAGIDTNITEGQSVILNGSGGQTYAWSPSNYLSDPNIANPIASPINTTSYILTVTNGFGCADLDTVVVSVTHLFGDLFVPNIFSPNGDGQNDMLYVYGTNFKTMTFFVYNRWGEKVFASTDKADGWDGTYKGKPCDVGVFAYYLEVTYQDDELVKLSGNVSLVR